MSNSLADLYRIISSLPVVLVSLMFLVSGCGGGDESPPLSKREFINQGNAICVKGLRKKDAQVRIGLEEIARENQSPTRADAERLAVNTALPVLEEITDELSNLHPPAKDEKEVGQIMEQFETALEKAEEEPGQLVDSDPFAPAATAARSYGLVACNV
jgi:hypothetical protein